ncbi:Uncharacterized membrane protein [Nitrosospira briensis]|uniref:Uncharacterized membrane protein n=2 Tax=Nitrosospira briensis TaxID=35799 RepID=A0A1I4YP89_9PROT|nr:Uncharacterized membrane protein [Nitrosospira briensis]
MPYKAAQTAALATTSYIMSVAIMRGLVIVLMALDHVRGFFTDADFSATDLSRTNLMLFLTRWVTHLCAPAFVFLAGTSAFLSAQGEDRRQLAIRLLTRGLWLVILELTVVRFSWYFNLDYNQMSLQVIWALGWSMVVLSALIYLPLWAIASVGILMISAHNLLDGIRLDDFRAADGTHGWQGWALSVLHIPHYPVIYPLIPWIGVMAAGYAFGPVMLAASETRRKAALACGIVLITAFVILRAYNVYGDPVPWSGQETGLFTLLSFLNTTKYPPSLLYLLMTLGPMFVLLAAFEQAQGSIGRFLMIFGRVPLFFYLVHLYVIHALAVAVAFAMSGDIQSSSSETFSSWWGFGLPVVYLTWIAVVILLYPVCQWFAGLKSRHRGSWWTPYI